MVAEKGAFYHEGADFAIFSVVVVGIRSIALHVSGCYPCATTPQRHSVKRD